VRLSGRALARLTAPIALGHENVEWRFAKARRIGKKVGMAKAPELIGLTPGGTLHRALDHALNVARVLPWAFV
jgi:inhibitor of KinA sporulation pathway (predicted exonuclease)